MQSVMAAPHSALCRRTKTSETSSNPDAIKFHNQWTHCKTAVGAMLSLGDEAVQEQTYEDDDKVY